MTSIMNEINNAELPEKEERLKRINKYIEKVSKYNEYIRWQKLHQNDYWLFGFFLKSVPDEWEEIRLVKAKS